jgi:hypothetical protein
LPSTWDESAGTASSRPGGNARARQVLNILPDHDREGIAYRLDRLDLVLPAYDAHAMPKDL